MSTVRSGRAVAAKLLRAWAVLALATAAGCGQKGPLVLPDAGGRSAAPQNASEPSAPSDRDDADRAAPSRDADGEEGEDGGNDGG